MPIRRVAMSSGLTVRLCSHQASYSIFIPSVNVAAKPSSIVRFRLRRTSGTHESMSVVIVRQVGSNSSGATIRFTNPHVRLSQQRENFRSGIILSRDRYQEDESVSEPIPSLASHQRGHEYRQMVRYSTQSKCQRQCQLKTPSNSNTVNRTNNRTVKL